MKTWAEEYGFGEACQILSALGRTFNLLHSGNVALKELLQAPAGSGPKQVTNISALFLANILGENARTKKNLYIKKKWNKIKCSNLNALKMVCVEQWICVVSRTFRNAFSACNTAAKILHREIKSGAKIRAY